MITAVAVVLLAAVLAYAVFGGADARVRANSAACGDLDGRAAVAWGMG